MQIMGSLKSTVLFSNLMSFPKATINLQEGLFVMHLKGCLEEGE